MHEMSRQPEPEVMDLYAEAEAYARADFADVNQAFVDRLLELAGHLEEAAAVDLGTGPADIPIRLARARPRWRVVAVDASEAMLAFARRAVEEARLSGRVELLLADAKATPLPSAAFDVVFSNSILHHINEADRFWAEVRRLGSSGATVFLRDLARPASPEAARQIVRRYAANEAPLLQAEYYRSLLASYTVREVRAQLDRAGLAGLRVAMVTDRHWDVFGQLE
jgi:ubiquinone/menaquinone biosynthesis C-methylase UbiE